MIVIIIYLSLCAAMIGGIILLVRSKKRASNFTMFGSTYEFYNKEKRAAIEHLVEQKVKKMEEQKDDKPEIS